MYCIYMKCNVICVVIKVFQGSGFNGVLFFYYYGLWNKTCLEDLETLYVLAPSVFW